VGDGSPSLKEVEDKIEARMAEAQAKAELQSVTPEGSMAELEREVDLAQADTVLDNLRAELGLAPAGGAQLPPASSSTQLPPASS
jgi:phage shock protein A